VLKRAQEIIRFKDEKRGREIEVMIACRFEGMAVGLEKEAHV
jgi:hypothetical protein